MLPDPEWEEVGPTAAMIFCAWPDNWCELDWAKHSWLHLARRGYFGTTDRVWRSRSSAGFISLCELYVDFTGIAWGKARPMPYVDLAAKLGLTPCYIAVLAAEQTTWSRDELDCAEPAAMERVLRFLSHTYRRPLVAALDAYYECFGSPRLFLSLLKAHPEHHYEFEGGPLDTERLTANEHAALHWVHGGCQPVSGG